MNAASKALSAYNTAHVGAAVETVSPHGLIQMLFDGALTRLASAKGSMQRGELARKGEQISSVITIIEGLHASLNADAGGEVARNLSELYGYMVRRLIEANASNQPAGLDEVERLMNQIKSAWDAVPSRAQAS